MSNPVADTSIVHQHRVIDIATAFRLKPSLDEIGHTDRFPT